MYRLAGPLYVHVHVYFFKLVNYWSIFGIFSFWKICKSLSINTVVLIVHFKYEIVLNLELILRTGRVYISDSFLTYNTNVSYLISLSFHTLYVIMIYLTNNQVHL
jgi:hypothetical protein